MKVALVHDYIKEYGGAERVLEALHAMYPDAPVYTSLYVPSALGPHRQRLASWDIRTSWLQYIPFHARLISLLRLLAPFAFLSFDLSAYDVVIISATGAYIPNSISSKKYKVRSKENHKQSAIRHKPIYICYCHTPPRYLYGYATAREWKKNVVLRVLGELANHVLRMVDFEAAQNVDYFIANSEEVASRIKKFYRKDATVINPPVMISSKFKVQSSKLRENEYFLAGGRLARPKHIDLIVKTCTSLNLPLKVFGKDFAGYGEELRALGGPTISFLGEVTDEEKLQLLQGANAYIFASEDEDFGITPVEAMSVGTPVIAYRSGGVKETVVEGETGTFYDSLTEDSLTRAIKEFERKKFDKKEVVEYTQKFSKERFMDKVRDFVEKSFLSSRV